MNLLFGPMTGSVVLKSVHSRQSTVDRFPKPKRCKIYMVNDNGNSPNYLIKNEI